MSLFNIIGVVFLVFFIIVGTIFKVFLKKKRKNSEGFHGYVNQSSDKQEQSPTDDWEML